jgi:hypothetical protein
MTHLDHTSHVFIKGRFNKHEDKTGTPLANRYPWLQKRENENRVIPPCNHDDFVLKYLSMYEKLSNAERGNGTRESADITKETQESSDLQLVLDA